MANAPAYASIAALLTILCAAEVAAAAARAPWTGHGHPTRELLQSDSGEASSCGVTATQVASAFDSYQTCTIFPRADCCEFFVLDLANRNEGTEPLAAFTQACRTALRVTERYEGLAATCELVRDQNATYFVLQPVLDRCENLRAPCAPAPPPPTCDTSVAAVNAAVEAAYASLRSCATDAATFDCTEAGITYTCPQSGICFNGNRCSFAPSRASEIACCETGLEVLYTAVPCLDQCGIYRISSQAVNFLTVCSDVSKC